MAVNIKVVHPKAVIKTTVTGILGFAAGKRALHAIVSLIEQPGKHEILVDTREAKSALSITEIFESSEAIASQPSLRGSRIVIFTLGWSPEHAAFLETVTSNRNFRARVVTDFEEAVNWLML